MAKYVVTGGGGFIGSHLVEALLQRGDSVVVIDNFSSGKRENLPSHPKLFVQTADIQFGDLYLWFKNADGVFHLAADARIQPSIAYPQHTIEVNVNGTLNILESMRKANVDKIVFSASSSSYGKMKTMPLTEDMPSDCLNPYSVSKVMGEELCKTWGKIYGIKNVSLKYFNVFGQRSPLDLGSYSPVLGKFFQQAFTNEPITVVGDGRQKRDFTYVTDVVSANLAAMDDLQNKAVSNGRTVNIGTGQNISIIELAYAVKDLVQPDVSKEIKILHIDPRPGESFETLADISLASGLWGWRPKHPIHAILPACKAHYSQLFVH